MSNEKTGRRGKKRIWGKDDTELSLLALPTTIWYLLFCFLPMFGIIIAFKNYKVYGGFLTSFIKSEWVGFNNFKFLFSSKDIWLILRIRWDIMSFSLSLALWHRLLQQSQLDSSTARSLQKRIRLRCSCLTSCPGSL